MMNLLQKFNSVDSGHECAIYEAKERVNLSNTLNPIRVCLFLRGCCVSFYTVAT